MVCFIKSDFISNSNKLYFVFTAKKVCQRNIFTIVHKQKCTYLTEEVLIDIGDHYFYFCCALINVYISNERLNSILHETFYSKCNTEMLAPCHIRVRCDILNASSACNSYCNWYNKIVDRSNLKC